MQDLLVGQVGFQEYLADLLFDLGGGAGGLGDVLDQVTRILQERFDLSHVREIIFAGFFRGRDGQVTRSLKELAGTPDTLGGENETGHVYSSINYLAGGGRNV